MQSSSAISNTDRLRMPGMVDDEYSYFLPQQRQRQQGSDSVESQSHSHSQSVSQSANTSLLALGLALDLGYTCTEIDFDSDESQIVEQANDLNAPSAAFRSKLNATSRASTETTSAALSKLQHHPAVRANPNVSTPPAASSSISPSLSQLSLDHLSSHSSSPSHSRNVWQAQINSANYSRLRQLRLAHLPGSRISGGSGPDFDSTVMYTATMRQAPQPFGAWSPNNQLQQPFQPQRLDTRTSLSPGDLSLPALADTSNHSLDFLRQRQQQQYGQVPQQPTPSQYAPPPPQQQRSTAPTWSSGYPAPPHHATSLNRQLPSNGLRGQMPFDFQQPPQMAPYQINTSVSSSTQPQAYAHSYDIIQQQGTYGQPNITRSWDPSGQTPTPPPPQQLNPMQQQLGGSQMAAADMNPNAPGYPSTVGRQGTRGIIPSDPGVEPPSPDVDINPAQDPDTGKFKCPNCPATFSFPKHVKRHFMRHTGVRPYECSICHATFARSDVLKRHFEKCLKRTEGWVFLTEEQKSDHLWGRRGKPRKTEKRVFRRKKGGSVSEPSTRESSASPGSIGTGVQEEER